VIAGIIARCRITERGAVSTQSRHNTGYSEKVVVTEAIGQNAACVRACFLAQDFDRGQATPLASRSRWNDTTENHPVGRLGRLTPRSKHLKAQPERFSPSLTLYLIRVRAGSGKRFAK
jgi:hypothetical protein